jgi:hypothetical protein
MPEQLSMAARYAALDVVDLLDRITDQTDDTEQRQTVAETRDRFAAMFGIT